MNELLEASRAVVRLWDNPQDLGAEVYAAAYDRLREAISALDTKTPEDEEYEHYLHMGGTMAKGQWEHVRKLHMQYIESDRISPYEAELML